jgi:hypothetical protein
LQSEAEHSRISNGSVRPITLPSAPAEKLIYLTITNFLAVLPVLNEEQNEISLILVQMEPSRKTETDGSSGRPVMSDEPTESSAKSVLTEVTRSNKRVSRASEVSFNKTNGNPSGLRETSSPVPSASKKWKNRSVYLYLTLLSNPRPALLTLFEHRPLSHRLVEVYWSPTKARSSLKIHILMCLILKNSNFLFAVVRLGFTQLTLIISSSELQNTPLHS